MALDDVDVLENEEENIEEIELSELENKFQVVRKEFFSHTSDAAVTFKFDSLTFNTASINKMAEAMYILILVNEKEHRIVIKMCDIDTKDSVKWCKIGRRSGKREPRKISARVFAGKIYDMMGWDPQNRYKISATIAKCEDEILLVFNLDDTEIFIPKEIMEDGSVIKHNKPYYPESWKDSFGLKLKDHESTLSIRTLDGYSVFEVVKKKDIKPKIPNGFERIDPSAGEENGKENKN